MKDFLRVKTWAGPLTIGSFAVMAATGILMFFHLNVGMVKLAHEWLGWLCVLGAAGHLLANWKPFLAYFRKPAGVSIMATMFVLGVLALVPAGGSSRRPPFMEAQLALEQSTLGVVAQVAKCSPQAVVDRLESQGIHVREQTQTISEVASDNSRNSMEVLLSVLGTRSAASEAAR